MSDNAAGSSLTPSNGPKAIGSLAKKPSDVTRQGAQRLKFTPTLPARRKKEEVKQETPQPSVSAPPSDKGNAKLRGRGRGRGGGEGRGSAPRPPQVEMTASGPFSLGPTLAGTSARRTAPRGDFTPIHPQGPAKGPALAANSTAPALRKDKQRENTLVSTARTPKHESDEEVYSEPDEGVEIIDMQNVRQLDWMAPETLQRDWRDRKNRRVRTEIEKPSLAKDEENVDRSNALDWSESEEEELEDFVEDFAIQRDVSKEGIRQERMYFFQFPEPFPTFVSTLAPTPESMDAGTSGSSMRKRKVSFAADTDAAGSASGSSSQAAEEPKEVSRVDGVIGQLEVYRSGMVKMRLGKGIVLNVSEATRPSFLQQAVHLDMENKKLHVLGEVSKRFVVSPDLDSLLTLADADEASMLDDAGLIKMDTM